MRLEPIDFANEALHFANLPSPHVLSKTVVSALLWASPISLGDDPWPQHLPPFLVLGPCIAPFVDPSHPELQRFIYTKNKTIVC